MTTEKRQKPRKFVPSIDRVYENAGGGSYRCQGPIGDSCDAWMQNTASGWTLLAHGIVRYEDGTIEWDWSTRGHFETIREPEPEEPVAIRRADIRHRQMSLMNAMLCMI